MPPMQDIHPFRLRAVIFLIVCLTPALVLCAAPKVDEVPTFQVRARVVRLVDRPPADAKFSIRFGVSSKTVTAAGEAWSDWLRFDKPQIEETLKGYPAIYMKSWPIVVRLQFSGIVDPTLVEAELKFDGGDETVKLSGELYGPALGLLLWRDADKKAQAATMAQYNRRYWSSLEKVAIPPEKRPRRFPIVDRFIGGDDDRLAWREGIEQLNRAGFSAIMLPPDAKLRKLLLATGQTRTAWAVYNPPGYAFDFDAKITPESIKQWARQQAKPYLDAGYAATDMSMFAMSDEPGWYFPKAFDDLKANPQALSRFRDYIKAQGLTPADVGAASWDQVLPMGQGPAKELPQRRLFYWTMRFFAHDSARHFAVCTKALEEAFYPGVPVFTNWNFFSGRLYVPGPVANNPDKKHPDAAMGGHDWLEFGRLRGGTLLWTEDWFSDKQAYQWSFYCAKLRCAAQKGGVQFGGYVIPRTAGDREDGILQKILCVAGSGGKAVKYFVFGPEYNFPGNCYSENATVLPKMAEAHAMIGAAEDVIWPGKPPRPQVAILAPRSATLWDARHETITQQIQDATNNHLNRSTVDYMAETFDLYLALQHANIPADFVDEDDLTPAGLRDYKSLYVTEPNVPAEGQRGIVDWLREGGVLVTVSGAAQADRYDEPSTILADATGMKEAPRRRLLVADTRRLPDVAKGTGKLGDFVAIGVRGKLEAAGESIEATFEDGAPAILRRAVGKGQAVHFAWMPGLSYWKSAGSTRDGLPTGFSPGIRQWITWPVSLAKVTPPVSVDKLMVESPMLLSDAGAALTLLNWTGEPIDRIQVTARVPFTVASVASVSHGRISFERDGESVRFALPLKAADVVKLTRKP